jgi:alkyl hydroperoxide reductase subunit AhpC
MVAYNLDLDKFADLDAQVVGISVDSIYSHIAWQKKDIGLLRYPLLSDFYPHGEVAQRFGVFRFNEPVSGVSERAVFVIDKDGVIAFSQVYALGETPDNEECFEALRALPRHAA